MFEYSQICISTQICHLQKDSQVANKSSKGGGGGATDDCLTAVKIDLDLIIARSTDSCADTRRYHTCKLDLKKTQKTERKNIKIMQPALMPSYVYKKHKGRCGQKRSRGTSSVTRQ